MGIFNSKKRSKTAKVADEMMIQKKQGTSINFTVGNNVNIADAQMAR